MPDQPHQSPSSLSLPAIWRTVEVDGLPITECKPRHLETLLGQAVHESGPAWQLATVNLDYLRCARYDRELRRVLLASRHLFADGWPVLRFANAKGYRYHRRVTGADLTREIWPWAKAHGWRIGLVGGSPRTAGLDARLRQQWGDNVVAGMWQPTYPSSRRSDLRDTALSAAIRASGAHILLVGLGSPKQDFWLAENLADCGARAGIGVGGSFSFLMGTVHRAPVWMQVLHLEFLHRMLSEPRRLSRRYFDDLLYLMRLVGRGG